MSIAVVFPGQGSQFVGMGKDIYESNAKAKELFDRAESIVPGLKKVMFEGPEEELKKTDFTQPAIFVHSISLYEASKERLGGKAAYLAGHSLGEYSALYAAGALDFETAVKLVRKRGALMQDASSKTKGSMAAVLGLDKAKIEELCEKVKGEGYLAPANFNSPGQVVVSGDTAAVEAGEIIAKELGAKRYIKLIVAGAFHSNIMQPAADGLKEAINGFDIKDAQVPVVANVSASEVKTADEIKELLVKQVVSPVLWVDSVEYMKSKGVDTFIETGPGGVLAGLIKKIDRSVKIYNIGKAEDIENLNI